MQDYDMRKSFPLRAESHQLEEMSERFLRHALPRNWTVDKPASDYGVDLRVELFDEQRATGLELLIQLKASAEPSDGETEVVRLKVSTYNYLWGKLQVAMLVKYVEDARQAYWILLRDVSAPNQDHDTFTVHIPRSNRIDEISWDEIQHYVRSVTDKKLATTRRNQLQIKQRNA